ncbi:PREDICTED: rho GTPase-activating protein 28 isoform X2 [Nicrophorus vespilloides]|uniref:Rho GTPase-activating protein 28 isoform X2 n=1 Tax=Nicrophorus vespilloides TaxID=110193 RepID=A0ABM1NFC8_NICVS|nr:PREDICTED: rho GTPase-activating protein 28 isoform X2 [Nicrophorus vespilloides]
MDAMEVSPRDSLKLYFSEVKDSNEANLDYDEEHVLLDEVELAADFLQKAGLSDLPKLYHQGKEISDSIVNDSIRQIHLTEKQAQTVRSRVRTLNKTLRNHRQPRRKQRQDIRDVTWNLETSSTGSRSRSATPDSLDFTPVINEDLTTSDEDQQLSLPSFPLDSTGNLPKGKLKWTSSEPIPSKVLSRQDRGDVAHLGSDNVVLKGYHPLNEYPTLKRERSGSDPSTDVHLKAISTQPFISSDFHGIFGNASNLDGTSSMENDILSFEGLARRNEAPVNCTLQLENLVNIDSLTDGEYQYLKPLLWVEVTAIFDQHKIAVVKRKASSKHKRGNVFGVNLSTLVMRDMPIPTDNSMVPQVYQSVIRQLNDRIKEDGILRIAGQKHKLEVLCHEVEMKFYNNRRHVETVLTEASVHDLTGVLKKLLRELPDPVFTMELFDMFYKCHSIPDLMDKIRALNILVLMLPVEHRNTFRILLQFFVNVIKNEKYNRMNLHNVAMISAPSFFPLRFLTPKGNRDDKQPLSRDQILKEVSDAAVCCGIMELILHTGDALWMIPAELANQAQESQKRAQDRKESGKEKKARSKKKLQRSSTQYEPGAMLNPRLKREFLYD